MDCYDIGDSEYLHTHITTQKSYKGPMSWDVKLPLCKSMSTQCFLSAYVSEFDRSLDQTIP